MGYPQITEILESGKGARKYIVPIIADGVIKCSGDIVKIHIESRGIILTLKKEEKFQIFQ